MVKKQERIGTGHPVIYFPNPKSSPGSSRCFRISPKQKATGTQDDRTIRQDDMTNRQDDTRSRQDDTKNRHRVIFDPDTASLSGSQVCHDDHLAAGKGDKCSFRNRSPQVSQYFSNNISNTSKKHTLIGGHVGIIYKAEVNNHKLKYFKVVFPGLHSVSAVVTAPVPFRTEIDGYVNFCSVSSISVLTC